MTRRDARRTSVVVCDRVRHFDLLLGPQAGTGVLKGANEFERNGGNHPLE